MFCTNCGKKIDDNENFCGSCGVKKESMQPEIKQEVNISKNNDANNLQDEKTANILALCSLLLGFGIDSIIGIIGIIIPNAREGLANLGITGSFPLLGLILMIIARIKYPNNKFAKIVMWIYIVTFVLGIVAMILFLAACMTVCSELPG